MNSLLFKCPHCAQELEAERAMFGKESVCPGCGGDLIVPDSRLVSGKKLDDFILRRRIGVGGMGEVWEATQASTNRLVAIKVMREEFVDTQKFKKRFLRELKSAKRLDHPNLVTAIAVGNDSGVHYMAMEFIDGETLEKHLMNGRLTEREALRVTQAIAQALDYTWNEFRLVHRDIKPSNIMITRDGTVKLLDMGVARTVSDGFSTRETFLTTGINTLVGTPHYMSPDQAEKLEDIDCRSDIYSLGIVFCEMLTGKPPFDASNPMEVISMHIFAPRPDLRASAGVSAGVSRLIGDMLARDRSKRPLDWKEVLRRLRKLDAVEGRENSQMDDLEGASENPNGGYWNWPFFSMLEKTTSRLVNKENRLILVSAGVVAMLAVGLLFIWRELESKRVESSEKISVMATNHERKTDSAENTGEAKNKSTGQVDQGETPTFHVVAKPSPKESETKDVHIASIMPYGMGGRNAIDEQFDTLTEKLNLSEAQNTQVHEIMEELRDTMRMQRKKIRQDGDFRKGREQFRKIFEETNKRLEKVLTTEQIQRYNQLMEQRRNGRTRTVIRK